MNKFLAVLIVIATFPIVTWGQATHKGISFQGVIKLPSGEYPTRSGLTVNARILSPNLCILREEQFSGVNISKGYLNLTIGGGFSCSRRDYGHISDTNPYRCCLD